MVAALPIFSPPDPSRVLADLADPALSFNEFCERHQTCITTLSLWLARPDITELSAAVDAALIQRARRTAAAIFPQAIVSLNHILAAHTKFEARSLTDSDDPHHLDRRQRARETARKAITLLLRIARFQIIPLPARLNTNPLPNSPSIPTPPSGTPIAPLRPQSPNISSAPPVHRPSPRGTAITAVRPIPTPDEPELTPPLRPANIISPTLSQALSTSRTTIPPLQLHNLIPTDPPPHLPSRPPTCAAALVAAATHPPNPGSPSPCLRGESSPIPRPHLAV